MLYPFKFKPILLQKVWGANRLTDLFGAKYAGVENLGESWEISGIENMSSVIENGFLAGNPLDDIIEVYMEDLVGEKVFADFGIKFPLLIKYIDTKEYLSVQVHPGPEISSIDKKFSGKAELWYIINAEPQAEIIAGFKKKVNKETLLHHLNENSLKDVLQVFNPKAGDIFYIPPGTLHAIGPGITLVEIQQASDTTFRLFDWDRPGLDSKPRELHTDLALTYIDYESDISYKISANEELNQSVNIIQNQYFTVNMLGFDKNIKTDYFRISSFVIVCCIEGDFELRYNNNIEKIEKGCCVLLPSDINEVEYITNKYSKILEVYL